MNVYEQWREELRFDVCAGLLAGLQISLGLIANIGGTDIPKPHAQPVSPAEQADFEAL
jgi:hypothetical protein